MSTHKKVDPRAIRSKRMFKEAVLSLLAENPQISQLTVQKIANRAELNRATFYLHYQDINDLLKQITHEIFDDLSMKVHPIMKMNTMAEPDQLIAFLDYIYEYRKFFNLLFENEGFQKNLFNLLKQTVEMRREARGISQSDISVDIIASSLRGIIMWWVKDGIQFSSEYIASQISSMYRKGPL